MRLATRETTVPAAEEDGKALGLWYKTEESGVDFSELFQKTPNSSKMSQHEEYEVKTYEKNHNKAAESSRKQRTQR